MTINTFIPNTSGYAPWSKRTPHKQFKITVHGILDMVPGAFHQPQDLANWILQNPYVRGVEIIEQPKPIPFNNTLLNDLGFFANAGFKIRAIRAYRAATGCSLPEAKNAIETAQLTAGKPHHQ